MCTALQTIPPATPKYRSIRQYKLTDLVHLFLGFNHHGECHVVAILTYTR